MRGVYAVRVKAGSEGEIARVIKDLAAVNNLSDKIFEVYAPHEERIKILRPSKQAKGKTTKTVVVKVPIYRTYVFVDMELDEKTYWFIKSIPGVKGFIGGKIPAPISESEVEEIKKVVEETKQMTAPKPAITFQKEERVRIVEGPLREFVGVIEEVNEEKTKLKLNVFLFGRPTIVEVDFRQVEKI